MVNIEKHIIEKYIKIYYDQAEITLLHDTIKSIEKNNGNSITIAKLKLKANTILLNKQLIEGYLEILSSTQRDILYMKYKQKQSNTYISMNLNMPSATLSRQLVLLLTEITDLIYLKINEIDYCNARKLNIMLTVINNKLKFLSNEEYKDIVAGEQLSNLERKKIFIEKILYTINDYIEKVSPKRAINKKMALREYVQNNRLKLKEIASKYHKTMPSINNWINDLKENVVKEIEKNGYL